MSNDYFQFKQFVVRHDQCSMKVTTDGVLLGAWADTDSIRRALDAGTGSGLIALMIAQRSEAEIDAVEIDAPAYIQACENAARSPWENRIHVHHDSFQQFATRTVKKYDLIVSNPPYFRNVLKSPARGKAIARHDLSLSYEELLKGTALLLDPQGRFCVILPYREQDDFTELAFIYRLYIQRITAVMTTPHASFSRILMAFGPVPASSPYRDELIIHQANGNYSTDFIRMTKDFYLHFPDA